MTFARGGQPKRASPNLQRPRSSGVKEALQARRQPTHLPVSQMESMLQVSLIEHINKNTAAICRCNRKGLEAQINRLQKLAIGWRRAFEFELRLPCAHFKTVTAAVHRTVETSYMARSFAQQLGQTIIPIPKDSSEIGGTHFTAAGLTTFTHCTNITFRSSSGVPAKTWLIGILDDIELGLGVPGLQFGTRFIKAVGDDYPAQFSKDDSIGDGRSSRGPPRFRSSGSTDRSSQKAFRRNNAGSSSGASSSQRQPTSKSNAKSISATSTVRTGSYDPSVLSVVSEETAFTAASSLNYGFGAQQSQRPNQPSATVLGWAHHSPDQQLNNKPAYPQPVVPWHTSALWPRNSAGTLYEDGNAYQPTEVLAVGIPTAAGSTVAWDFGRPPGYNFNPTPNQRANSGFPGPFSPYQHWAP